MVNNEDYEYSLELTSLAFVSFLFLGWVCQSHFLEGGAYFDSLFSEKTDPSLFGTFIGAPIGLIGGNWQISKDGD